MSNVGRMVYGRCAGFFGPRHAWPSRIEAEGHDWLVVRRADEVGHEAEFTTFESGETKYRLVEAWSSRMAWKTWSEEQA